MIVALLLHLVACSEDPFPVRRVADPCARGALPDEERILTLEVDHVRRQVRVWHPKNAGPHDVIVALHDHGDTGRKFASRTGWVKAAWRANAILVAPDGLDEGWNAGTCCGTSRTRGVDDVRFLDALAEQLQRTTCTSGRTLVVGEGAPIPVLQYQPASGPWPSVAGAAGLRPFEATIEAWSARDSARMDYPMVDGGLTCSVREGRAPFTACTYTGNDWPGQDSRPVANHALADATDGGLAWIRAAWDDLK